MIGYLAVTAIRMGLRAMQQKQAAEHAQEQKENDAALAQMATLRHEEVVRDLARERATPCCASCGTKVSLGIAFCHLCGSSNMTNRGIFTDLEAENKVRLEKEAAAKRTVEEAKKREQLGRERREKEQRQAERERHQAAKQRCQELLAWRYCEPCHATFESTHRFCTGCGQPTQDLPKVFALEYAQQEYPDLITDQTKFDRLC